MTRLVPALLVVCGCSRAPVAPGGADFQLELGSLYERYRDASDAAACFARARELAASTAQSLASLDGLARARLAEGDRASAIAALEEARRLSPEALDLANRLAQLYAAEERWADADRIYTGVIGEAREPALLEAAIRARIEILRRAGTLARAITDAEAAGEDERTLRFLAAAHEQPDQALPFLRRLRQLRPEDTLIRQRLQALLEQTQHIDEALALLRSADATPPPEECALGLPPPAPALAVAGDAVRLLIRAGRKQQALEETARIAAGGGPAALVAAAQLYLEEDQGARSASSLKAAEDQARTPAERRALEAARAELLSRSGDARALRTLYSAWAQSEDTCLRAEGERRNRMMGPRGS